jgi:hypothetical protein
MKYLTLGEYEALAMVGLRGVGLTEDQARALLGARWPLIGPHILAEAAGRGLITTLEDVQDWAAESFGGVYPDDGSPIEAATLEAGPLMLEDFLGWCVRHGRAIPALEAYAATERKDVLKSIVAAGKVGEN